MCVCIYLFTLTEQLISCVEDCASLRKDDLNMLTAPYRVQHIDSRSSSQSLLQEGKDEDWICFSVKHIYPSTC